MKAVASAISGVVLLSTHGVWAQEVPSQDQINAQIEALLNGVDVAPLGEVLERQPRDMIKPLAVGKAEGENAALPSDENTVIETISTDPSSPIDMTVDVALSDPSAELPSAELIDPSEFSTDGLDTAVVEDEGVAQTLPEPREEPEELRIKASDGMRNSLAALRQRTLESPIPYPQPIALAPRSVHGPLTKGGSYLPPSEYRDIARKVAQMHSVPEDLFFKLVKAESNWNQDAVSRVGALGLAQLMPGTADYLGVDPLDPFQNLEGGARYLSEQYARFGTWELALAAYNAGPGAVKQYGGVPPYAETQAYVQKILFN